MKITHLSPSSIALFEKDRDAWAQKYLEGVSLPPTAPMFTGSCLHFACAAALSRAIMGDGLLGMPDTLEAYDDEFDRRMLNEEVAWGDAPAGAWKDKGRAALLSHYVYMLKRTAPVAVEVKAERAIPDTPFTLLGIADVLESGVVRDAKFGAKLRSQADADDSFQLSCYAWLFGVNEVSLDCSTWSGQSARIASTRTPEFLEDFIEASLIPVAMEIARAIEEEEFTTQPTMGGGPDAASWIV